MLVVGGCVGSNYLNQKIHQTIIFNFKKEKKCKYILLHHQNNNNMSQIFFKVRYLII
jgi:hypothetical protein